MFTEARKLVFCGLFYLADFAAKAKAYALKIASVEMTAESVRSTRLPSDARM